MKSCIRGRHVALSVAAALACLLSPSAARADVVTDWNQQLERTLLTANASAIVSARASAIMHAAVFDAVNGIERRYTPIRAHS